MPRMLPNVIYLPFLGVAPHMIHFVSDLRTTDVAHAVAWVSISSQEHEIHFQVQHGRPPGRSAGACPVAKTTNQMSASSSIPSANLSPLAVKHSIAHPFLSLMSPSMMCFLVPVSLKKMRGRGIHYRLWKRAACQSSMCIQKVDDACPMRSEVALEPYFDETRPKST